MGVKSKDIDYSVVLNEQEKDYILRFGHTPFEYMGIRLVEMGYDIKVSKPEFLTIRAIFPKGHKYKGGADFVLARKEADYTDGRRPDTVVPGTLQDDLARRDFTMNAMAEDSDGNIIDPFGGVDDINAKIIRAVGSPVKRLNEDALRGLRALRFSITKGFTIEKNLSAVIGCKAFRDRLLTVSNERIREELEKMFANQTVKPLRLLDEHNLIEFLFNPYTGIRLMPTMKG
jgi:tRNA nucleotidyltransferase/poly(A) polymerase